MQCQTPINLTIRAKSEIWGKQPYQDVVPCGRCYACLSNKRKEWVFRAKQETKTSHNATVVTLTYSEENVPYTDEGLQSLNDKDTELFMKRLRRKKEYQQKKHKYDHPLWTSPIRFYLVGEYGTKTFRPHYHALLWNVPDDIVQEIPNIWGLGHVKIDSMNEKAISYVMKYVITRNDPKNPNGMRRVVQEYARMSRKPGIGYSFVESNPNYKKGYVEVDGYKQSLPTYYKNLLGLDKNIDYLEKVSKELKETEERRKQKYLSKGYDPEAEHELRQLNHAKQMEKKLNTNDKF